MPTINPYPDIEFGIPDPPKSVSAPAYRYRHQEYPKVLYRQEVDPETGVAPMARTVKNLTEHQAMGEGWYETPAAFPVASPEDQEPDPAAVPAKKRGRPKKVTEPVSE